LGKYIVLEELLTTIYSACQEKNWEHPENSYKGGRIKEKILLPNPTIGSIREEDKGDFRRLTEALRDLDGHVSQHVRITSQFIVIPAVNHGLGDGDLE